MRFKIPGLRRAGVAAVAALTAGAALSVLTATSASAASPPAGSVAWTGPPAAPAGIAAVSQPGMVAGTSNSPAGNLTIEVNATTFASGDSILVAISDSDDPGTDVNCNSATDFVAFHATPTVTVTSAAPGSGVAQVTASLVASAPCVANSRSDILKITFTNGSNTFPQQLLTVTNVAYDSGTSVGPGAVTVTAAGCAAADAACAAPGAFTGSGGGGASNALIATAFATANTPPVATLPITGGQAISNIVITEVEPAGGGILVTGTFVCVSIQSPGTDDGGAGEPQWTSTAVPTVTAGDAALVNNGIGGVNGSSASATFDQNSTEPDPVVASGNPADAFGFKVAQGSSTATSYTISGLKLDTSTLAGVVNVGVGVGGTFRAACDNAESAGAVLGVVAATVIVSSNRIGGADRYGTAAALFSPFGAACGTNGLNAVLARGDLFADALAANYLAGSLNHVKDDNIQGTGILLTTPNTIPDVTLAALRNSGATDVFIVGQTSAVSQAVEDQLKATPAYNCGGANQLVLSGVPQFLKVTRIGGATRYDTAQLIAQTPNPTEIGTADLDGDTTANPIKTGIVATGTNFPDALAAGPMAFWGSNTSNWWWDVDNDDAVSAGATSTSWGSGVGAFGDHNVCCSEFGDGTGGPIANGFPLLLTDPNSLSPQAQAGLLNDGVQQVILMGGTAAVSTTVANQIQALGISVIRLAGADRSDTAAKAAALETGTFSDLPTGTADDTALANCNDDSTTAPTCTKPIGLFYRTDHINVARGDDAGGGADALAGGPHSAGLDSAAPQGEECSNDFGSCSGGDFDETFEGPTPILLTQDPNTLATATHDYLAAHSTPKADVSDEGPTPNGGLTTIDVFGQTAAISNATATAALNALTGV